jgi:uncharacterized protein
MLALGRSAGLSLAIVAALLLPAAARAGPAPYPGVAEQQNVPIVMRDGTTLYANVLRPAGADGEPVAGSFPTILTQTPYNKDTGSGTPSGGSSSQVTQLAGRLDSSVRHGYNQVVVDVRGTGQSGGQWDSFGEAEQRDALDVVNWIHQQPWDDGRLALYGASYMGINQLLTAEQHPPGLKAIFPIIPGADLYRDVTWHGGSIDAGFIPLWLGLVTALKLEPPTYTTTDPNAALREMLSRVTGGFDFPLNTLTNGTLGGPLAYDGPFYQLRSPITKIDQVNVPTFITGGLWDLFQRGEPQLYNALRLPPGEKQLLIGPWYHVTTGSGLGAANTPPTLDELALAWFDRWVKGIHNGIEHFGPVTLYQLGSERWTTQGSYPGAGVRYQRLYLTSDKSGSAQSINDGTLAATPPVASATDTVLANPINGLCSRSTEQWTAGLVTPGAQCTDQNALNEASGLTYTTAAATAPLQLTGPLSLTLRASTTAHDTTWIATLADVAPDGSSRPLTAGWLMPSRRAVDLSHSVVAPDGDLVVPWHPFTQATLEPVVAGETETLNVEIFPTDAVIEPGHRLRLALTHGDVPHMLAAAPDALNSLGAVDSVHIDPAQPSFLTLPVAGPAPGQGPGPIIGSAYRLACGAARVRIRLPRLGRDRVVAATVFAGRGRRTFRGRNLRSVVVSRGAGAGRGAERVRIVLRTARGRRLAVRRTVRGRRCV